MNVYESLSQDILIEGDLYYPVMSQKDYNEIVVEVSRELRVIGKKLIEFFEDYGSYQSRSNQCWLDEMIKRLENLNFFRQNMEDCNLYQFYWKDGFLELFADDCTNDIYDKGEKLMQAWYCVKSNGVLAIRSVLRN